jgi:ribosomal protein RSM22 (predicted rRNA methylase)
MSIQVELSSQIRLVADRFTLSELRTAYKFIEGQYRDSKTVAPLSSELLAAAYVTSRMPATYMVALKIFSEVLARFPKFQPTSMLDLGAGPGSAIWAAIKVWSSLNEVSAWERESSFIAVGKKLLEHITIPCVSWEQKELTAKQLQIPEVDLVVASYMFGELNSECQSFLFNALLKSSRGFLLVIEPGTPQGFSRIATLRDSALYANFVVAAPCCSQGRCPSSWCHFSEKVQRSKSHRLVKEGALPYEFEHYSYILIARNASPSAPRIVERPSVSKHAVKLKVCSDSEVLTEVEVRKRDSEALFKSVKKLEWGDYLKLATDAKLEGRAK